MDILRKISFLVLIVAGAALAFSFYDLGLWFLPYVAFIPFLGVLVRARSYREAFRAGFIFGFAFFTLSIYWLFHVASIGVLFCIAYSALYYGVYALLVWHIVFRRRVSFGVYAFKLMFYLPLCGVILEYIRTEVQILGFGWALLGYSQTDIVEVISFARILGVYGVSAFILFINAGFFVLLDLSTVKKRVVLERIYVLAVIAAVSGGIFFYGKHRADQEEPKRTVKVAVVQPNISQEEKWQPELKELIIQKTLKLMELVDYENPDVIIAPEAAYPGALGWEFLGSEFEVLSRKIETPIIIGAPHLTSDLANYNSAFFIENGEIKAVHDKLRLVPFGEFIPFRPFFALFGLDKFAYSLGVGDFRFGTHYTIFNSEAKEMRFGVLICFEDTMPSVARTFILQGANILVNITNDAWFNRSVEAYQHLQASRVRAIENNCYLVRAANTGISAFIDPNGRLLTTVKDKKGEICFVTAIAADRIGLAQGKTFFQKTGYFFPNISVIIILITLCFDLLRIKRKV